MVPDSVAGTSGVVFLCSLKRSQFEGEERESLELDASVSDSLPSPHKSSYIPSAMERWA